MDKSQNKFAMDGPNELVQHFAYSGSSHQRKSADRHIPDMVWLHFTSSVEEDILLVRMISTCLDGA
jgi:hypothetical protein